MKKVCNVVMLPTEKASQVVLAGTINPILDFYGGYRRVKPTREYHQQHLYIITNDEIKEGDYFYADEYHTPEKAYNMESPLVNGFIQDHCKKIIASTDYTLGLPLIPEGFVKKYVELQGKIDKVMVEYWDYIKEDEDWDDNIGAISHDIHIVKLKTRRDNTIIISKYNNMFDDKFADAIHEFQKQYPSVTSADLQTFALGWQSAIKNCL